MKTFLFLLLLIISDVCYVTNAQVDTAWARRFGGTNADIVTALAVDSLGNVYVTGSTSDLDGESITTIKYSSSGQLKWVAKFKPSQYENRRAYGITVDDSLNVFVAGFSRNPSEPNTFLTIKYDSTGQEKWFKYYGPFAGEAVAIASDNQGNVYVTGFCTIDVLGWDYVTIKYDWCGQQQWVARYTNSVYGDDFPKAIAIDELGNVYVTGTSFDSTTYYDIVTVKYNSLGLQQWVRRYDDPGLGGSRDDCAYAIAVDKLGNIVITGGVQGTGNLGLPPENYLNCVTIKYDSNGNKLWESKYDRGFGEDWANDLALDSMNNIFITGTAQGSNSPDYLTIKYSAEGQLIWDKFYNGLIYSSEDYAKGIATDKSGNVYVTGKSGITGLYWNFATIKYDNNGEEKWLIRHGDNNYLTFHQAIAIAIDNQNNVFVTGITKNAGTYEDFLTIKYVQTEIISTTLISNAIAGSQTLNVASIDGFSIGDSIIINPGGGNEEGNIISGFGSILLQAPLQYNHYAGELVIKFNPTSVEENDLTLPSTFELYQNYPNPFNPNTVISYQLPVSSDVTLKIYDVLGNEIATLVDEYKPAGRYEVEFNTASSIKNLASGIYFYQLKAGDPSTGSGQSFMQTKKMLYLK